MKYFTSTGCKFEICEFISFIRMNLLYIGHIKTYSEISANKNIEDILVDIYMKY